MISPTSSRGQKIRTTEISETTTALLWLQRSCYVGALIRDVPTMDPKSKVWIRRARHPHPPRVSPRGKTVPTRLPSRPSRAISIASSSSDSTTSASAWQRMPSNIQSALTFRWARRGTGDRSRCCVCTPIPRNATSMVRAFVQQKSCQGLNSPPRCSTLLGVSD